MVNTQMDYYNYLYYPVWYIPEPFFWWQYNFINIYLSFYSKLLIQNKSRLVLGNALILPIYHLESQLFP